ncbi:MFS transporter [Alteromonas halophila]|uniref:MFS transporter n=1 Tax=Alteromonas halophila TaxID=516698 RepID=A0A918JRT0_9ALTE|nr:MFS transporter [Alteromonas halophila]GGW96910.1 MFS transporter [Alteromonas halophila]
MTLSRQTATALLVAAALFMEILDATVITTAIPVIAKDFGVPATHLSVGVSAYLVAVTLFIPLSGYIADKYGAKRIFMLAICTFVMASVLCGISDSLAEFTLARILQGIGGAMMVPVGRLVVLRDAPKAQLVHLVAIITWPALSAPLLGPVLGGWIATHWGWPWIFYINVPLGLIALLFTSRLLTNRPGSVGRFDTLGFVLSGGGFALFMTGLELLASHTSSSVIAALCCLTGLSLLAAAIFHLHRAPSPLLSFDALAYRTFRITLFGGSVVRIALASAPFLIPLMLQLGLGYSPIEAGTLLLWLFAGNLAVKPATTWLMNATGFKRLLIANAILIALGYLVLGLLTPQTPYVVIAVLLFVCGMNRSIHLTALNTLAFADVPQNNMRDANTLGAMLAQMNRGLGITIGALAVTLSGILIGSTGDPAQLHFQIAMAVMALFALLSTVDCLLLPSNAGNAVLKKARSGSQMS